MDNLDGYIENLKASLNEKVFSPVFIRLANVYFLNKQYEACISVCKTGLEIYPDYLTARVLMLKSLLKLGHLNEAEKCFNDIESKIANLPIHAKFKESLVKLRQEPNQERIFYNFAKEPSLRFDDNKDSVMNIIGKSRLKSIEVKDDNLNELERKVNRDRFEKMKTNFDNASLVLHSSGNTYDNTKKQEAKEELFGRIKIVTETLADIYAQQGNFKEAFNAYNLLLRAGTPNKKRIESKLLELERINFAGEEN
ncbi:MAG: CDC27 family protein [Ignavibacteriae bacterium]|nr:CDC27 family protein [Ignavibacteriota bacterium]